MQNLLDSTRSGYLCYAILFFLLYNISLALCMCDSCEKGALITAKETFKRILEIPLNFAHTMLMAAAGHLASLISGDEMKLGGICLPKQWVEVDFSVTSSIYPSRWQDWFADTDTEAEKGARVFSFYY